MSQGKLVTLDSYAVRRIGSTPSLRGVNIQSLFGSQRAMKTMEDFTEFGLRAMRFDDIFPRAL